MLLDIINDDDDESEPPTMLLQVKYPDAYPEEPPILDILSPPNAPAHTYFNISSDKDGLLQGLSEAIEENMGMAMVFTLVSTLKDNAEQLIAGRQEEARRKHEERRAEVQREEDKKFHGTVVNKETFLKWREEFRKEMEDARVKDEVEEEAAEKKRNRGKDAVVLLTGKQLWERGMVGKLDEDEDDDELPTEGVEKLKVEA